MNNFIKHIGMLTIAVTAISTIGWFHRERDQSQMDDFLNARIAFEAVVANLQNSQNSREQYEHAIAVLVGAPPGSFPIALRLDYVLRQPGVPPVLPSALLKRRHDAVSPERTAAATNARQ